MTDSTFDIKPGITLSGRFQVDRMLGQGAIGSVWLARDADLEDEEVAVKALKFDKRLNRAAIADLKREVLVARRLRHPNILAIHTFWQHESMCFITMEYVDGDSLATLIADRQDALAIGHIIPYVEQLSEALDFAHSRGILHRDIKPANILVDRDNQIRLVDFGIAMAVHDIVGSDDDRVKLSGTIQFMSPEQLRGLPPDHRSDQYSLASTIYEMLSGRPPFTGPEVIVQVQVKSAPPIETLPGEVNAALLKALAKDPAARYESCGAFCDALAAAADKAGVLDAALPARPLSHDAPTVTLDNAPKPMLHKRLGAILVAANKLTPDRLKATLKEQRLSDMTLGEFLIANGTLNEEDVADALDTQLGLGRFDPRPEDIHKERFDALPEEFGLSSLCVPLMTGGEAVLVAMADPLDLEVIEQAERHLGSMVEPRVTTATAIRNAIAGL